MRALTYHGAKDLRVDTVPDPVIEQPDDIVLRVTATAICGSDLHIYRGKIPMVDDDDILGHEFMGVVEEAGAGVTSIRKGDRVFVPFTISCGECFFASSSNTRVARPPTTDAARSSIARRSPRRPHCLAIISHRLRLTNAPRGYEIFEEKQEGCRKVVLTP